MKKSLHAPTKLALLALTLCIVFVSGCTSSKKADPKPAKTKTQILTANDWIIVKEEFGDLPTTLEEKPLTENVGFRFTSTANDSGTFISKYGNGSWTLTNNEATLHFVVTADPNNGIEAGTIDLGITFQASGDIVLLYPVSTDNYPYNDPSGTVYEYKDRRQTFAPSSTSLQ